jgi:hypothetical protein
LQFLSVCTQFLTGGFNEKAVVTQVTNGKNAMPAFGGRLSDDGALILKSHAGSLVASKLEI